MSFVLMYYLFISFKLDTNIKFIIWQKLTIFKVFIFENKCYIIIYLNLCFFLLYFKSELTLYINILGHTKIDT